MKKYLPALFIIISDLLFGQVVYQSVNDEVYNYLDILSRKGIISFDDLMKPVPRKYIAMKLLQAEEKENEMTGLESEELEFYLKDYNLEMEGIKKEQKRRLSYFGEDNSGRIRLFSYSDSLFKINISPILGYSVSFPGKERESHAWNGMNLYGYLSENIGFNLYFRLDNEVRQQKKETMNRFSPVTGKVTIPVLSKSFDYSETHAMLSTDWSWGTVSVGKDFMEYGYGESGKLVLSTKAPSFPFFRINIKPADWFTFNYFHAWLNSDIIDSVNLAEYRRSIYREKYFAWHSIIITPLEGLNISLGESIVYSDRIEFIYLIPVMFFHLADDFVNGRRNKPGDANSQIFLAVSSRGQIKNIHMYGTLFIDELTIPNFHNTVIPDGGTINNEEYNRRFRTQLGYTLGASVSDMPFADVTFTAEYTRINPYVYGHHTPAQTYTNSSYLMGHWIGQNSDLIYLMINYRILRGLKAGIWGEYIRKGSDDYSGQYKLPQPEFLFGLRKNFRYIGIDLNYQILHELNISAGLRFNKYSEEQQSGDFSYTSMREFSISLFYGL